MTTWKGPEIRKDLAIEGKMRSKVWLVPTGIINLGLAVGGLSCRIVSCNCMLNLLCTYYIG